MQENQDQPNNSPLAPRDPNELFMQDLMQSCPAKVVMSGGAGFVLGGAFRLFMASADFSGHTEAFQALSAKDKIRVTLKEMGGSAYSGAKNFAIVGALYSATDCAIETYRAKNDIWNSVTAGCISGATLSAKSGPQAMAIGCAGFAAFSTAIEYWMRHSD